MFDNLVIVFNFIISKWSLSPKAFKDAVLVAALANAFWRSPGGRRACWSPSSRPAP